MKDRCKKRFANRFFGGRFYAAVIGKYIVLDFIVAILFYNSAALFIGLMPMILVYIRYEKRAFIQREKRAHKLQFREAMTAMYGMIASGYSLESAIKGVPKELSLCYTQESWIIKAFLKMSEALKMNIPAVKCLEDFAFESNDDDIMSFYEIICIAKKYGGSMTVVIKMAIDKISRRIETEYEMMTIMAGRKNEFTVMALIPACIILYMRVSSPDLISVLYTAAAGRMVMTLCLGLYAGAVFWGHMMIKKTMAEI